MELLISFYLLRTAKFFFFLNFKWGPYICDVMLWPSPNLSLDYGPFFFFFFLMDNQITEAFFPDFIYWSFFPWFYLIHEEKYEANVLASLR